MILVCGEALIDFFPSRGPASTPLSFEGKFGGSPFNVAFGITRMGIPSAFFSCLSTDLFGTALKEFLVKEGVDLSLSHESELPTTLAFVQLDANGSPQYAFNNENAADRMLTVDALPKELSDEILALSFGSFSLAVEPCATAYETLMQREAKRRVIALDPNIRPRLIADMDAHRQRIERMLGYATLVKVSTEDLQALYGTESPENIARAWQKKGPALIVVTDGPNGAYALLQNDWITYPGKRVNVIDTVGAGDTFQATLLSGLHQRKLLSHKALRELTQAQLAPVVENAIAAASLTCTRRGAELPYAAEIEAVTTA